MKKAIARAPLSPASSVRDVMDELKEKRPAGGTDPGEPRSKQQSESQKYAAATNPASPSPDELSRAQIRFALWRDYHAAKTEKERKFAFTEWVAFDDPDIAGMTHGLLSFLNSKAEEIKVFHPDLACRTRESIKAVQRFSRRLQAGGFVEYEPGHRGGTKTGAKPSRYRLTVPKTDRIEEAVWWTKMSINRDGASAPQRDETVEQTGVIGGQNCPPIDEIRRTKLSTPIYLKPTSASALTRTKAGIEGEVSLKGNPPPTDGDDGFTERPGSKFATSRATSAKRSDASSETPASTPDRTLFDRAVEDLISLASGRCDSRQINKVRMRDQLERGSGFVMQPPQHARFSQYEQAAEVLFDDTEWASTIYQLVWGR